jgi:ferredoxin-type protein NapH
MRKNNWVAAKKNMNRLQYSVRLLLFISLLLLVYFGMERFWVPVLLSGIGTSFFWGRWYCAWVCPVKSASQGLVHFTPKIKPVKNVLFAIVWFSLLLAVFLTCLVFGVRVRLFVWISGIGIAFSILFSMGTWCGSLCPWGFIMRWTNKFFHSFSPRRQRSCSQPEEQGPAL